MRGIALVLLCGLSAVASADDSAEVKKHFERGTSHYALGEFTQAAEEYQAAFRLKADPVLLYDAAQAFRLAGNHEKALLLYHNYVVLFPQVRNVAEVNEKIAKLKAVIAAADRARSAAPNGAVPPTEPAPVAAPAPTPAPVSVAVPAPVSVSVSAPALNLVVTAPPTATPIYKRWWPWTIAGAVVVAAAVVVLALVLTASPPEWANAPAFGPGAH